MVFFIGFIGWIFRFRSAEFPIAMLLESFHRENTSNLFWQRRIRSEMLFLEMFKRFSSGFNLPSTGCLYAEGHFGLVWASTLLHPNLATWLGRQSGNFYCQVDFELILVDFEVIQCKKNLEAESSLNKLCLLSLFCFTI